MTEGTRHTVGVIAGVVLTPVIFLLILHGADRFISAFQFLETDQRYIGALLVALAAIAVGFLASAFVSPVGSLLSGVFFLALGVIEIAAPADLFDLVNDVLPDRPARAFLNVSALGIWLLIGVILLVTSTPPSRWRPSPRLAHPRPAAPIAPGVAGPVPPPPAAPQTPPPPAPRPQGPSP